MLALLPLVVAACARDGRDLRPASPDQRQSILTTTTTAKAASIDDGGDTLDDTGDEAALEAPTTVAPATIKLTMTLPWADGAAIDPAATCKGAGTSPAITWTNMPSGTAELALTVTDDDAAGFVHWIMAGIPATATGLAAGAVPDGAVQGKNDNGTAGWFGPCPPAGAKHRYRFTLYALTSPSGMAAGAETRVALAAVQRNVVGLDVAFGTFTG